MSWTDERVEKLQEMWAEGMSAAQIAKALGGVTRNAVIGKVHRLGLSNRGGGPAAVKPEETDAQPEAPAAAPVEPAAVEPPAPAAPVEVEAEAEAETPLPVPAPPVNRPPSRDGQRREPAPMSDERIAALKSLAEVDKAAKKISLLELTERVCKWPIGDPTEDSFHFCGHPSAPGRPYCSAHCAIAFQPMSSRRDRDRNRPRT